MGSTLCPLDSRCGPWRVLGAQIPVAWHAPLEAVFPMVFLSLTVLVCTSLPHTLVAILSSVLSLATSSVLPLGWSVLVAGLSASLDGPALERLLTQGSAKRGIPSNASPPRAWVTCHSSY